MKNYFVALILLLLAFPHPGSSQERLTDEPRYEVHRVYSYINITKERLKEAQTLIDLNPHYKSSWIREYISVEILTTYQGKIRKAVSKNDTLSREQKDLMSIADPGENISVVVQYIPDNTLKNNDIKEIDFTLTVDPDNEATYPGGQQQLQLYLKQNAIDKIPKTSFKNYDIAAVKFTISEEGEIINAHVSWSSGDKKTDELLLETISNMPCWEPAGYSSGPNVKQEFVFIVGNMESCVINLLNIRRD